MGKTSDGIRVDHPSSGGQVKKAGQSLPGDAVDELAPALESSEIRQRALVGAAAFGLRGITVRIVSLGASVALARMLVPRDFGLVAIGVVLLGVGGTVADSGLTGSLIRRATSPKRRDLQALLFAQLTIMTMLTTLACAICLSFGRAGQIAALMMLALPLQAPRAVGRVVLERRLEFGRIVWVEVFDVVAYNAWAIATVAAGWGVWGLASASIARAAMGTALLLLVAPEARLLPRPSWSRIVGLLKFGAQMQGVGMAVLVRDQAVNVVTGALGGLTALGHWSLAYRVMNPPYLVFESLWRVTFPAMSRLSEVGDDLRKTVEQTLVRGFVFAAALLVPLAASAQALIPFVFGDNWAPAAAVVPPAAAGLAISGAVSAAAVGYLYAQGDAGQVLRAIVAQSLVWVTTAAILLPLVGVVAVGFGWLAGGLTEAALLTWALRRRLPVSVQAHLTVPVVLAVGSAVAGWLTTYLFASLAARALLAGAVSLTVFGTSLWCCRRAVFRDVLDVGRRMAQSVARRDIRQRSTPIHPPTQATSDVENQVL